MRSTRPTRTRRAAAVALGLLAYLLFAPLPSGATTVPSTWKQISTSGRFTCAIGSNDVAWCWGYGGEGNLGDGSGQSSLTPVPVDTSDQRPSTYKRISVGENNACAIAMDDTAWCWGYGGDGANGKGSVSTELRPAQVDTDGGRPSTYEIGRAHV